MPDPVGATDLRGAARADQPAVPPPSPHQQRQAISTAMPDPAGGQLPPVAGVPAVRVAEPTFGSAGDSAASGSGSVTRFFGIPDSALSGTWVLEDLCAFLRTSERKARQLMKDDGAPPPLRLLTARCLRWNPYEVIAWVHGQPIHQGAADAQDRPGPAAPVRTGGRQARRPARTPSTTAGRAPGTPWAPTGSTRERM